ncbi:Glucose-6-phosphate 1-epimerase [Cocos nucifera]|uniref:glucose-6-phosphate 1-epimerase n=1 Tax=Cocos nucifera TaxID=13894 RepID=A0A8K0I1G0_COCNU|nr:Glucose-6-phosphate 1-epimerase [Cocos nucifera]
MSGEKPPVEFCKGINGLDKVVLREVKGSSAEVYPYGGQVTSWKNDHGEELLFVSSKFSNNGPLEQHGFARNRFWSIDTDPPPFPTNTSNKAFVDLILKPSEEDMKIWPHSYEFRLRVTLGPGGDLMLTSRIRNTNNDGKPFSFTFAYHTYFSVSDIRIVQFHLDGIFGAVESADSINFKSMEIFYTLRGMTRKSLGSSVIFQLSGDPAYLGVGSLWFYKLLRGREVRVEGLETLDYLDNLQEKQRFTEQGDAITFESEVMVWNPWDKKAKAMADFGDDEYKYMLCVEAAAIEKPITLKPGEEWKGRLELSAVPSSYCSGQLDPQRVLQG